MIQNASTASAKHGHEGGSLLSDFTTNRRVLLLCALAIPIGCIAAVVAKVLLWLIAVITNAAFLLRYSSESINTLSAPGIHVHWWWAVVPIVGGLIVGLMARYGTDKIRGHGIPEAVEAILLGRSLMNPKVAVLKPVSSAICIGTGGPFGAEGPIIVTGGAFGSLFAQLFHLTSAERKTLLVSGAAAGMAAVFATPIAAVLLAVELLLFEWKPRSFIPVTVAAIIASVMRVPLIGSGPMFPVVSHTSFSPKVLLVALVIGCVIGFASVVLTWLVYGCEDFFAKRSIHWMWWPAIGGVVVGLGGLIDPRVLGVGYDTIDSVLNGHILGLALVTLIVAKGVVWAVSLGSGTSGGILAPLLMIGGALGGLVCPVLGVGDVGLGAMIGMAAMMGGTMGAPLTGTIFVLELTHDLNSLPALLAGTVVSLCITVLLLRRSVLTEKLARRGQHVAREYVVDVFSLMRVGDVMDKNPPVISANATVAELSTLVVQQGTDFARRQATLIERDGTLAGIITRGDLLRAQRMNDAMPVAQAGTLKLVTIFADETLSTAMDKMLQHDIGRLPVVSRETPMKIIGYLGRAEIMAARMKQNEEEQRRERGPTFSRAS